MTFGEVEICIATFSRLVEVIRRNELEEGQVIAHLRPKNIFTESLQFRGSTILI